MRLLISFTCLCVMLGTVSIAVALPSQDGSLSNFAGSLSGIGGGGSGGRDSSYPLDAIGKEAEKLEPKVNATGGVGAFGLVTSGAEGTTYGFGDGGGNELGGSGGGNASAGKRLQDIVPVPGVTMFSGVMKHKGVAKMFYELFGSPLNVQNTTVGLSESGLSQANAATVNAALGLANAMVLSQIGTVQQMANFAEWGEGAIRAFYACIKNNMKGGSGSDEERFVSAYAQCSGDKYTSSSGGGWAGGNGGTGEPMAATRASLGIGNLGGGGDQNPFNGELFSLADDPNMPGIMQGQRGSAGRGKNVEFDLWSLIFGGDNQAAQSNMANPNPTGSPSNYSAIKKALATYAGNYTFTENSGSSAGAQKGGAYLEIAHERLIPREKGPVQAFKEQFRKDFEYARKAFYEYCSNYARPKSKNPKAQADWFNNRDKQCDRNGESYCALKQKASFQGNPWNDDLVKSFVTEMLRYADSDDNAACDKVFGKGGRLDLQKLVSDPKLVTEPVKRLEKIQVNVTLAKMRQSYKVAEEVVKTRTSGTFPSKYRELALSLIREAARTDEIVNALKDSTSRIGELVADIPDIAQSRNRGGSALSNTFDGQSGQGGMPNNMAAGAQ